MKCEQIILSGWSVTYVLCQREAQHARNYQFFRNLCQFTKIYVTNFGPSWFRWIADCGFNGMKYRHHGHGKMMKFLWKCLKLVSAVFYQFFIFHQMIALQKLLKMFFISSKKFSSFSRYSNFCISAFPSFSPCQPLL